MINKPIKLEIQLSYSQAVALIKQLQYRLAIIERKNQEEELSTFKKWRKNETK